MVRSRVGSEMWIREREKAQKAWDEWKVRSVVIGDVPCGRVDNMPYGGIKESG
mgnify:CR=1 FL=1